MDRVDQRRSNNQPAQWLGAAEATALLEVQRKTLYAYVSRGLVRRLRDPDGHHLYARDDLERLRSRRDARAGHGPVAAGALRWGDPVLESAITEIAADGPRYRGEPAVALAARGVPYERVAERLWGVAESTAPWPRAQLAAGKVAALAPRPTPPLDALLPALCALRAADRDRFQSSTEAETQRARKIVRALAAALAAGLDARRLPRALAAPSVASAATIALGVAPRPKTVSAIDAVLVVSADHELNASAFAARVAASAGADLYACLSAAAATLTGPRHGGACDRVEALLDEVGAPRRAAEVVAARLRRGEAVPGFGHPLYPDGDPRARLLLEIARGIGRGRPRVRALFAVVDALARTGGEPPTLDAGLVAVADALALPRGAAGGLFALGRSAGWIAHALEQRAQGVLLRPRARYVGSGVPAGATRSTVESAPSRRPSPRGSRPSARTTSPR